MKYNTMDYDNLIDEIQQQINRINNEMDIHKFTREENVCTYNKLTNILLILNDIK
ncbi:MAG TPA: hypothetical protein GX695_05095 [Acholeplasmataceae bacterium]|nr:hypothetical protein [Acholeplasmataceae bacterium]